VSNTISLEKFDLLSQFLSEVTSEGGMVFTAEKMEADGAVLQVIAEGREEFPIYLSVDEDQVLCFSYLWTEAEVNAGKREQLLEALLTMNMPLPLSAFSKIADQYILFGALAMASSVDDVIHELEVLSDNTLDAVESMSEFLR
jgi:uncharacterized protein